MLHHLVIKGFVEMMLWFTQTRAELELQRTEIVGYREKCYKLFSTYALLEELRAIYSLL